MMETAPEVRTVDNDRREKPYPDEKLNMTPSLRFEQQQVRGGLTWRKNTRSNLYFIAIQHHAPGEVSIVSRIHRFRRNIIPESPQKSDLPIEPTMGSAMMSAQPDASVKPGSQYTGLRWRKRRLAREIQGHHDVQFQLLQTLTRTCDTR
jgi:hypothetical protein